MKLKQEAMEPPQLVDDKEASRILQIPLATLRYWRVVRKGPQWIKIERLVRYDIDDLRAYIAANRSADPSVRASIGG